MQFCIPIGFNWIRFHDVSHSTSNNSLLYISSNYGRFYLQRWTQKEQMTACKIKKLLNVIKLLWK
jgi:hypothetical protein